MSTVVIVEIQRYHWSEKVIKKSYTIIGASPYATALELHDTSEKVSPHEKGSRAWRISKCFHCVHEDKSPSSLQHNEKSTIDPPF